MVDLHTHILPGLDDGARSWDETLAMAEMAAEEGTRVLAATPHYMEKSFEPETEAVQAAVEELRSRLEQRGIPLEIALGAEVYLEPGAETALIQGKALSLNQGRKYALVELPMGDITPWAEDALYALRLKGIQPILAHPERNHRLLREPERLLDWVEDGLLLQINAGSLTGEYGKEPERLAINLLQRQAVHFLGSDAHSPRRRSPRMGKAVERILDMVEREYAREIISINGRRVLAGQEPIVRPLAEIRTSWFKRLAGMW